MLFETNRNASARTSGDVQKSHKAVNTKALINLLDPLLTPGKLVVAGQMQQHQVNNHTDTDGPEERILEERVGCAEIGA